MDDLLTPDGVQRIRENQAGPIVFRVSFTEQFVKTNQRLQKQNSTKLFLQLRDSESKATAYLSDEAFEKLHKKLLEGDLLEVFRYEVQEVKPGQKIVKVTMADIIGSAPEQEGVDETSNSFDQLNPFDKFDRPLVPTKDDKPAPKNNISKFKPSVSKSSPFGSSFQKYLDSLGNSGNDNLEQGFISAGNSRQQTPNGKNEEKPSPFMKDFSATKRNVSNVSRTLFSADKDDNDMNKTKNQDSFQGSGYGPRQQLQRIRNDDDMYTTISELRLWDKDWMIKVRVYFKGNKVRFTRQDRNESSLFTINLIDKDGGEISATFFDNACVEKYYDSFEVGKTYALSGGIVKPNPKKFGKSTNDLQINFDSRSPASVIEVENDNRINQNLYNFVKIQNIFSRPADSLVDVVGIVVRVGEVETIDLGDRKAIPIKKIEIMDNSLKPIEVALWDYKAALKVNLYDLIMISPTKIKEFAGVRTLSVPGRSEIILNNLPDTPAVRELCEWYNKADKQVMKSTVTVALLEEHMRMISDLEDEPIEVGLNSWIRAYVAYIFDEKLAFAACPHCKKEIEFGKEQYIHEIQMSQMVQNTHNFNDSIVSQPSNMTCSKCGHSFPTPTKRPMMRVKLADATGSLIATAFGASAEILAKKDTEKLFESQIMQDHREFREFENQIYREHKIKVKYIGDYQGHKKYIIQKVLPLDFPGECQDIMSRLDAYQRVAPTEINSLYDLF